MHKATVSIAALCAALTSTAAWAAQSGAPAAETQEAAGSAQVSPPSIEPQAAPPATPAEPASGVADIVVTAQRRSENLQRVPISVAALGSEKLQANGVVSLQNLQAVTPGVVVAKTFAGLTPFIRGVGLIQSGFTSETPVAIYVDGVYIPNAASSNFGLNDVERVEVLKGPQGTLFGRNAVGGVINIITRDPSQTPGIEGNIGYGNYNTIDANVYATTGLTDNLAFNFSGEYHNQQDGWGTNLATGQDLFKQRSVSLSSKLLWKPTSGTRITLRGLYDHSNGTTGVSAGVFPGSVGVDGTRYVSEYDIAIRNQPYNINDQKNAGLKIEQDIGSVRLVSITGYNHVHSNILANSTPILGNLTPGQGVTNVANNGHSNTVTQELQLQSNNSSALQWIVGAFYMHDHFILDSKVFPLCIGGVCNASPTPIETIGDQVLDSYAAFGEGTLTIARSTRVTLGLRYTSDHKDESGAYRQPIPGYSNSVAALPAPNFFGDVGAVAPKAVSSKLTWRAVLAHDFTPTVMGYLSANRGFKGAAFNPTSFTNPVAKPEVMDAYEAGLKTQLFDRKLRFNIAGFYYDYRNIQLRTLAPPAPPGQAIVYNAARAHIKGIDADAVFAPTSRLAIDGSVEILDAKFTSFPGGVCTIPRVIGGTVLGGATSIACDLSGNRLQKAPKFSGSIGLNYWVPTAIGKLALYAGDTYNSGFYWDSDDRLRQPAYHQVNATLTWTSPSSHYDVQLYVRNLNKPRYFLAVTEASGGSDAYSPGEPRTFGVKAGFKF